MKRPTTSRKLSTRKAKPRRATQALPASPTGPRSRSPVVDKLTSNGGRAGKSRSKRAGPLSATIYADLRQQLVSLQRLPDEPVSESEIAEAYGVSRTPVREAILKLADEGLLDIFPQSGIFVSRIPVAELPEAILIRRALEETTARIAATQATASQLLALQSVLQSQREAEAADDHDAFHLADEAFHATIAEVAGYPGIWTLIQQVKVHVDRYRRLTLPQPGRITRAIAEHETILAAISAHDPVRAVAAITDHLERLLADISATQQLNPDLFEISEGEAGTDRRATDHQKQRGRKQKP
ncbi:GntR family transcriptional regulator [Bradyrhizobium prioriisuperbiae]|uniref:GntR family transcriptional regulator n=1 Tax=Bradyrhizobium prioriisuperbiae TaxID=2854389 RepID=UPI0028E45E01|nr:GntR family transcriptional regulator [Bradyrhizobium prioritasuperba]